jgi:formylglycine-generating enzyme required for sulfatase activity
MKHPDLFISHASADSKTAEELVDALEKSGLTCWLAPRDISIGSAYQAAIVEAIEHCRALLLVFSDAANRSEHVLREIELAAQGKKPIYPVRIDRTEPTGGLKYMLANKQWVERKALGDRLGETIVRMLIGTSAAPDDARVRPQPAARVSRPTMIAGGGVALVALLATGWLITRDGLPGSSPKREIAIAGVPTPTDKKPEPPASVPQTPAPVPEQPPAPTPTSTPSGTATGAPTPVILTSAPADAGKLDRGIHLFKECDACPVMAVIPAGQGSIGSPNGETDRNINEGPQQTVVMQPFALGRSEVSFEEWTACVAEGGCNAYRPGDYGWGYGKQPVINVSWKDAKAYVEWLSRKTGATYRLPSEAEWEYAARGCQARCAITPFWFGKITPALANYDWRFSYDASPKAQPPRRTVATDASEPNPFGLLHVHGNVREWVEDCWNANLASLPKDGSARTTGDCNSHVVRGGSWADEPKDVRLAARSWEVAGERRAQIGFRVARSLAP